MRGPVVGDVMVQDVVTVTAECGYKQIVDTLADHKVSAVPVVNGEGRVIGIVSEADLLHKVEFNGAGVHAGLFDRRRTREAKDKAAGETAMELMTRPAITIDRNASLSEAARVMERHNVKRLPVVDNAGRLSGIVARRDLLRPYLRSDADLRADIVEDILRRTLWLDPIDVDVLASDGRVTLRGRVDRRSTAEIATKLVGGVAGVVGVVDQLGWDVDDTVQARQRYMFDAEMR
jgi:CBS domain-containing protein